MTVLLATDTAELYAPGALGAHGWREPSGDLYWSGPVSLQLLPGISDPQAAAGGGHGPHGPARDLLGNLYLPLDAGPAEGSRAVIRGQEFYLSQVREIRDPAHPGGGIGCWAALATGTATWDAGGDP